MGAYSRAAHVLKPKSLNGWAVCQAADGLPFALEAGMDVHFVPPILRGPRQARVAEVRQVREGVWEVRFEGIETIEDAQAISGCYCLADSDAVSAAGEIVSPTFAHMVGYTLVEATEGEVGPIVAVQPGPAQDWLVVRADGGDVLVPAVDAFLGKIDHESGTVHATLPPGLLELGRSDAPGESSTVRGAYADEGGQGA